MSDLARPIWLDKREPHRQLDRAQVRELTAYVLRLEDALRVAKLDTARLDWREKNPSSAEPMVVWHQDNWHWRYMGRHYETLRGAIDAALRDEEPEGKS